MRILLIHNTYQKRGGEDVVFENEATLLESHGHIVKREVFSNEGIPEERSLLESGRLAASTVWSGSARKRLSEVIRQFRPEIAHFHNTFPLVSPAGYSACLQAGVPVVQTLHNYRLLCSNAFFYRNGRVCEDCLSRGLTWPGIYHACYRGSRAMSATISAMQVSHQQIAVRKHAVDVYVALSESSKAKFVQGGFPAERIEVKPNFVPSDPGIGEHQGRFALYVGRLSPEKGLRTLLAAWDQVRSGIPLKIVGDGPLSADVMAASQRSETIEWLGMQSRQAVLELMGEASFLIFPSEWYETFGLSIIEAYSRGTPVIASNIGTPSELVQPSLTGIHFNAGDALHLASKVDELASHPEHLHYLRTNARRLFETNFTAERNYSQLMGIYEKAKRTHLARKG